ncbi:MAG: hypothetical protein FJ087_19590 [Deltaproteobacteria bacterium]|nr:hypothetical protein [Deltaproteobacteria bacterium]
MRRPGLRFVLVAVAGHACEPASPPVTDPVDVVRVYPDGREERVRGLRIEGMGARAFKDVLATGDTPALLETVRTENLPGEERQSVAGVSVSTPSILFEDVVLKARRGPFRKPPEVPRPAL